MRITIGKRRAEEEPKRMRYLTTQILGSTLSSPPKRGEI